MHDFKRDILFAMFLVTTFCLNTITLAGSDSDLEPPPKSGHHFKEFTFSGGKTGPSIVMVDDENNVWVALAKSGKLARWQNGSIREYNLPEGAFPVGIAIDAFGQVWFSDIKRTKLGKLDPQTGAVKDYDIPTQDSWPFFIVIAPDGKLWFTERMGNKIASLDPYTGEVVEIPVPTPNSQPAGMAVTPDGQIFFTQNSGHRVGQYNPETQKMTEYELPSELRKNPYYGLAGIASDSKGNIWFAELDGRLGFIAKDSGMVREIPVPDPKSRPAGVAIDKWGIIWFTELDGNAISSYNPELEEFRRYPIPTGKPDPKPMAPPEITARGELPVPGNTARTSRPFGIAADSEGRIWFSEQYAHKLGVLTPPKIEIFQPSETISEPYLTIKHQLRFTKYSLLNYFLDEVPLESAELLDLTALAPGRHTFKVNATNQYDEIIFESSSSFVLNPTLPYLKALLERSVKKTQIQQSLADEIEKHLRGAQIKIYEGNCAGANQVLRNLIPVLNNEDENISSETKNLFLSHLHYREVFGKRKFEIKIHDMTPYLRPNPLVIEVGDRVNWTMSDIVNDEGRSKIYALNGDFSSPLLSPGSEWSHIFYREGKYNYTSTSNPGFTGTIVVKPRTVNMLEFPLPAAGRVPGVLKVDHQDNVWFTEGGGGYAGLTDIPMNNMIGKLSLDGVITEYETPTLESAPTSIDVAPDGTIWFTERGGNNIGKLDPATGKITEYPLPTPLSGTIGIGIDPEGTVWFTEKMASKIGKLDPVSGDIVEWDTPTPKSQPSTIISDQEGIIWFDQRANDRIVRFDPRTGEMREYQVPTKRSSVIGLMPDNHGHVWFLELAGNKVGRLDVETGAVMEYTIPTRFAVPFKTVIDRDGRLWFTEAMANQIGLLQDGRIIEFEIPTEGSMPGGIALDSKGNIWFSQQAGNKITKIPLGDFGVIDSPPRLALKN